VIFMDDPLSAVDAHVGEALFDLCIKGELMRDKTRVLVTHHVHFLERCDTILVMDKGRIVASGTFQELQSQNITALLSSISKDKESNSETTTATSATNESGSVQAGSALVVKDAVVPSASNKGDNAILPAAGKKGGGGKLMGKEENSVGAVSMKAYEYYCKSGGWGMVGGVVLCSIIGRAAEVLGSFWLVEWSSASLKYENRHDEMMKSSRTNFFLTIYACLCLAGVLGLVARALFIATHRINASQTLHEDMVKAVLRAPVDFFDTTPMGRVINRFSADIQTVS
jgi:ABC-type multidrug transport system fused ATPase/permease subunit